MAVRIVVFDVGETLINEERMWGFWADHLGVTRLRFFAVLERGEHHRRVSSWWRLDSTLTLRGADWRHMVKPIVSTPATFIPMRYRRWKLCKPPDSASPSPVTSPRAPKRHCASAD